MQFERSNLILIYFAAAVIGMLASWVIWRRHAPGSRPLALMVLSASFWALCDGLELSVTGVAAKRLVSQVQYLSVTSVAPLFFHSALTLSRQEKRLTRGVLLAVWGISVASLAVAWTSQWHQWLWKQILIPDPVTNIAIYVYGWWFWVITAQSYLLLAVGTIILLKSTRRVMLSFRGPMLLVAIAVLLPWLGNIAYVFKLGPWPGVNWFSICVSVSGILLAWTTLHGGLLDLLPRAREALVECMTEGVVVLDRTGRVLLRNSSAREVVLGWEKETALPEAFGQQLPDPGDEGWQGEVELHANGTRKYLDVRATAIRDRWGEAAGRLLVVRDITAQKRVQQEKDNLIAELKAALDQVQTLEGLLPVCASCKKIRDDRGYWNEVESYFAQHSNVRFTHGICPQCAEKLFPEHC